MTNAVVVYDNNDLELGDFFCSCVDSLDELFEKSGINPIKLGSSEVNTSNLCSYISPINEQKFFFLGFVHGTHDSMLIGETEHFVSLTNNYYLFSNAFIYAFSCYNGADLADTLLENKALVFLGYSDKAWVIYDYIDEFKECALSGYRHFLNGATIEASHQLMIKDMNEQIDALYEEDFFVASMFMRNRDALIVKGNMELTIDNFSN